MKYKRGLALVMALAVTVAGIVSMKTVNAYADEVRKVSFKVTYGQTEARKVLDLINDVRENDAWYEDADGEIYECDELEPLEYDYGLEKIAMQRAAELIFSDKDRPDGSSYDTIYPDDADYVDENYAYDFESASEVNSALADRYCSYEDQATLRTMLDSDLKYVGVGHLTYNGKDYWVESFSSDPTYEYDPGANDSETKVTVSAKESLIRSAGFKTTNEKKETRYRNLFVPGDGILSKDGYIYCAHEMGGLRMGITRVNPKTGRKKVIFNGNKKHPRSNGYYYIQEKGKYLYFGWDRYYGTDANDMHICRVRKDGSGFKVLDSGTAPVVKGNKIYYVSQKAIPHYNEGYTEVKVYGIKKMDLNGSHKKMIKESSKAMLYGLWNGKVLYYNIDSNYSDDFTLHTLDGKTSHKHNWFFKNNYLTGIYDLNMEKPSASHIKNAGTLSAVGKTYYSYGSSDYIRYGLKFKPADGTSYKSRSIGSRYNQVRYATICGKYILAVKGTGYPKDGGINDKTRDHMYLYTADLKKISTVVTWKPAE